MALPNWSDSQFTTPGGTKFREMAGSPFFSGSTEQGFKGTRVLLFEWDCDIDEVTKEFLGYSEQGTMQIPDVGVVQTTKRHPPMQWGGYPKTAAFGECYAVSFSVQPVGRATESNDVTPGHGGGPWVQDNTQGGLVASSPAGDATLGRLKGVNRYDGMVVTFEYASVPYKAATNDTDQQAVDMDTTGNLFYCDVRLNFGGKDAHLKQGSVKFADNNAILPGGLPYPIKSGTVHITRKAVAALPLFEPLIGTVNGAIPWQVPGTLLYKFFDLEQLRLVSVETRPYTDVWGNFPRWDVTFNCAYQGGHGHNYFIDEARAPMPFYAKVVSVQDGSQLYPAADWSPLFR